MLRLAINGFGRIGRVTFRVARNHYKNKIKIVAINTSGSMDIRGWAHMLKYDSVYGQFKENFKFEAKNKGDEIGGLIFGKERDRKSTRLNSSHGYISYAVFCL